MIGDARESRLHEKCDLWVKAAPVLVQEGLITQADAERAILESRQSEGRTSFLDALESLRICTRSEAVCAFASSAGVPFCIVDPSMVRNDVACNLPPEYLLEHHILPISSAEGWITIVMERFFDLAVIDEVSTRTAMRVQVIAATVDNIEQIRSEIITNVSMSSSISSSREFGRIMSDLFDEDVQVVQDGAETDDETDLAAATDSPVINMVNRMIHGAVDMRASDIHIEPEGPEAIIRYRIDGALVRVATPSRRLLPAVISRIKILANMDIAERRLPQDGAFTVNASGNTVDLRVSTMATKFGEKAVLRVTDRNRSDIELDELGMDGGMRKQFMDAAHLPTGLILVTGPTGSGKTTTLYAALKQITTTDRNVSTVEDPVEHRITGTSQFQINEKAGFSFARALRSLLRQDPDTIMVGEVRDRETASLVVQAAMTGHLVLSTLHTNDAIGAIGRLVDMDVEPFLVSATLRCVLAQRLMRRLCHECRHKVAVDSQTAEVLVLTCGLSHHSLTAWESKGCHHCSGRGYRGRIGVFELLSLNEPDLAEYFAHPARMITPAPSIFADAVRKATDGLISMRHTLECVPRPRIEAGSPKPEREVLA